jgi:PBP1b-binding outer membrane lipoprotein LpoB
MKKLAAFGIVSALLFASGCNQEAEPKKETTENTETKEQTADVKTALLDFQMQLVNAIVPKQKAITAYDSAVATVNDPATPAEEKPKPEEVEKLKADAVKASQELAQDVKNVEIPAELEKHKDAIQAALDDLSKSYESRSKSIGGDVTEADNLFNEFQTKMGKIFEEEGLLAPDFLKSIS